MKNILFFCIVLLSALWGCHKQDVDTAFEARNGIYFMGEVNDNGEFVPYDSVTFSFGLRPESIRFDTVRLSLTYLGRKSDMPRKYKVRVVEKSIDERRSTDMVEGEHYLPLESEYVFAPDTYKTVLSIIIDRKQFSPSFHQAEEHSLVLRLEENDDFYIGIDQAREIMVKVNNYMSKPAWWDLNGFFSMEKKLGFYHPEKWKALIYVDEGFANPDELPFDKNNGAIMSTKIETARNLNPWWPKVDEDTGDLVYFDRIITNNQ